MNITELLLTVPAITATVQWLKTLGVTGRASQLAAVLVGIAFSILTILALYSGSLTQLHSLNIWIRTICEGFLYGLCAAGFYDLANGNLKGTHNETNTSPNSTTSFINMSHTLHPSHNSTITTPAHTGKHEL